jgi:two-component system CheB/CheR fusion protein
MAERPGQGHSQADLQTLAPPPALYDLVVIGASAGGIEALSTVLGALAPDFPAPIVVAQHLDPHRTSHLDTILTRRTRLVVRTVGAAEKLAAGTVYLVPADRDVEIDDHEVRLRPAGGHSRPSINRLFSSAARLFGERLIAVILTGSGSDGAEGAWEVKAAGGVVIIEDPTTAAFAGMPQSLAPTTVDLVAHLEQIGPLLHDLLGGTTLPTLLDPDTGERPDELDTSQADLLESLLTQVRQHSGIDFTSYRRPTIVRRLQRRMVATGLPRLGDYLRYLFQDPDEYQRLVSSFLIKVTEFFRDPELFAALGGQVLPDLIAQARAGDSQLRLWSAGCATGEEAYSLAILVAEALGPALSQVTVRLFATDLDERAVAFARRGIYPAAALAGVSNELRDRYFTRLDGTYEVKKPIRGLVIFGEHDLGQRPPFPHIDLVVCRNVLIYFTPELQQRALRLFAFALRPGGYLALGKSESAGALSAQFTPAHPHLKLYHRMEGSVLPPKPLAATAGQHLTARRLGPRAAAAAGAAPEPAPRGWARRASLAALAAEREWSTDEEIGNLLFELPVGVAVVDREYRIRTINSTALRLLDIYRPAIGGDLVHLAERAPSPALRRLIDTAFQARPSSQHDPATPASAADPLAPPSVSAVVPLETGFGERRVVRIVAYPWAVRVGGGDMHQANSANSAGQASEVLLLVMDGSAEARRTAEGASTRDQAEPGRVLARRDDELARLRAELERMTALSRQLMTANQELGASNLELHRTSDDLLLAREQEQATVEEIRTLNEELQASNEELETVNEEMEATVEELRAANDDLAARTQEAQDLAASLARKKQTSDAERARLAAILLSIGDAVLVVASDEAPLLSNAAYKRLFGEAATPFMALDVDGRPLPAAATPQQRAARGETFLMEFILNTSDVTPRYFEASGRPIESNGEELGGVVTVRDITERSLHRLQDEFLAMASHELRAPLTPLKTYLQRLVTQFAGQPEDAHTRELLARALQQTLRLQRLVRDLLDARRLQQGGFNLEIERMSLNQVVSEAVEAARTFAPPDQVIAVEGADTPLFISGDAMRLGQVLTNLLTNAIIYAPDSPRIVVRLRRLRSDAEVRVHDEGPGIAAAALPRIFSRFYQVERTQGRASQHGLGLGLYIAHELVAAHGGTIAVTSRVAPNARHGTTFTIRLPLVPTGGSAGAEATQPAGSNVSSEPTERRPPRQRSER